MEEAPDRRKVRKERASAGEVGRRTRSRETSGDVAKSPLSKRPLKKYRARRGRAGGQPLRAFSTTVPAPRDPASSRVLSLGLRAK